MSEDYRARARALRAESQSRLRQLRAERLGASRRAVQAGRERVIAGDAPAAPASLMSAPPVSAPPVSAPPAEVAAITVLSDVAALALELSAAPVPERVAVEPEALASDDVPPPVTSPDAADAASPEVEAASPDVASPGAVGEAGEGPTIATLPGVGPGLVWMLAEAGVRSIDELLASDPEALSGRLGLVGRLIDVARLQRLAAELSRGDVSA